LPYNPRINAVIGDEHSKVKFLLGLRIRNASFPDGLGSSTAGRLGDIVDFEPPWMNHFTGLSKRLDSHRVREIG
jgi:hypothetical protein